jgi:hypothetical protein
VFWNDQAPYPDVVPSLGHEEFVNTYEVIATIDGCATVPANFMMMEMTQTKQLKGIDFTTRSVYSGTWQIVPESGRGPLASLSGSGTSAGDITYSDDTTWARTFTGTVTCP